MEIKSSFWIYIILILCLISLVLITTFSSKITTRATIQTEHGFTKAICDENNYCEDYEVVCEQNQVKSFTPTGMVIQNPVSWKDSRTSKQIDEMCD